MTKKKKTRIYKYNRTIWKKGTNDVEKIPCQISYTEYNTERILDKVHNNQNNECYLGTIPVNEYQTGKFPEPEEINQKLADQLDKLFEAGADLLLETYQGHDDEGGDCYQAYIVLPEFTRHAWSYWDLNYERDGQCLWQLCIMEYINKFPSNLRIVWAGAY